MSRPARVRPRVRARAGFLLLAAATCMFAPPRPLAAQAADSVVWVWLDDDVFPTDSPPAIASASLARRARDGIGVFATDAAVPDALVRALEEAGLDVRHRSRWLRAVSGSADIATLARIRALPFVTRVTPVARMSPPPVPLTPPAAPARTPPPEFYGVAYEQLAQIGVPIAHDLGFTGAGVVVALLDTGFRLDHVALAGLDVIATRDFIQGDDVVQNEPGDPAGQHNHGTQVWSALAGHEPDAYAGPAYGASFLLAKVDHLTQEPRADEDRWVAAIEWADSMGAQIVSSSLGYRCFDDGFCWTDADLNGDVAPSTIAADAAAERGILVVNSAGNDGRGDLIAPADGDSVLAVGAVNAAGQLAAFSSTGPTGDGRIKPELVARGVGTWLADPASMDQYRTSQGTSFAAPLVAGGAALFMEAWPELSAMAALRALLLSGSIQPPNDSMGRGLPDVASAILFPQGIEPIAGAGTGPGDVLQTLAPRFAWSVPVLHPAARPVQYVVQIASDARFVDVVLEDSVVDAQVLTLSQPLQAQEGYWWRVQARTAPGVVRTSAALGPFEMAPWVRLVTLNETDPMFVNDATPLLVWAPLPAPLAVRPLGYDVEILSATDGAVVQLISSVRDTSVTPVEPLAFNVPYRWRVVVRTAAGAVDTVESTAPFVVTSSSAPPATLLYQNFPNPFPRAGAPATTIWFDIDRTTRASLAVYDLRGRLVRRLIPDALKGCTATRIQLSAGAYGRDGDPPCVSTTWDGRSDDGEMMPAGVYLIRLTTDRTSQTVRTLFRP